MRKRRPTISKRLEAQLVPLRAELQRLQTLLDRCYLRQSVIPDIGAVLVNA
jgi:hypothetical protein